MKMLYAFLTIFFLLLSPAVSSEDLVFQSGPAQNTLVILFTSDAAVACNPALDWMSAQKDKDVGGGLWSRFVPIALHVKHWDAMGYRDAFAKNEFEEILLAHQKFWGATNVYAPTVVANGVEWSGWSRQQEVPSDRDKQTGTLVIQTSDSTPGVYKFSAEFNPSKILESESFTLHASLVAFGLSSKPSEGRNRGKVLKQDFIATLYRNQDFSKGRTSLEASVEIPMPKIRSAQPARYGMVFWVTKKNGIVPLQTTGGLLPTP